MSVFYDLNKTPRNILNQAIVRAIVSENNGLLFDPSDMSTLYQDAAGTIPVTAVEQPVGLMLDKARGMMLGPELVSNGTFDSGASGWTADVSVLSVSGGVIRVTNTAAGYGLARQVINTTIGKMYEYKGVFVGGTGASSLAVKIGTTNYSASAFASGIKFLATATTTTIQLNVGTNVIGAYMEFDSASLKELYGYHATQPITASRPTLSARKNLLVATDVLSTQTVTTVAAKYCLSFWGTGVITLSGTATGTLVGTGTESRVWIEITPTAGTLTLTVSGSVLKAQLEFTS